MKLFTKPHARRMMLRQSVLILFLSFATACVSTGAEQASEADYPTKGYNCLLMGHSFFAPIANAFAAHPNRCGFLQHHQTLVRHGGKNGSPGMLWESSAPDVAKARELLETGTVDLLGLTYYPNVGSDVSDYRKWVNLALRYNPNTRFIIHAPWARYNNSSFAEYEAASEKALAEVHQLIDQLRMTYPKTTFLCIPQGRWMVSLWRLYNRGELPEVSAIQKVDREDKTSCLFKDTLGHGDRIPVEMGALLWLAVIYPVDLNTYGWETNTKSDLKKLAMEICQNDPYCGLGSKSKPRASEAPNKSDAGDGR